MANANKVHFGLKNVHYAKITYTDNVPAWGTPVAVPGAVSLTLSKESGTTDFYADDTKYYHLATNNGYTGSLEMADFPVSMRKDLWNYKTTTTGKMLVEDADAESAEFALMFEIDGDQQAERYCLMRVTADRPDVSGATKADSVEVQTQSCDLVVMPVLDPTSGSKVNGMVYYRTTADTPAATYDDFYEAVDTAQA